MKPQQIAEFSPLLLVGTSAQRASINQLFNELLGRKLHGYCGNNPQSIDVFPVLVRNLITDTTHTSAHSERGAEVRLGKVMIMEQKEKKWPDLRFVEMVSQEEYPYCGGRRGKKVSEQIVLARSAPVLKKRCSCCRRIYEAEVGCAKRTA